MTTELATTDRPKPISGKVREAIASMVVGDTKNITAAAAKVGLSREHLSRELSKPHIADYLNQKVRRHLASPQRGPARSRLNCWTPRTRWSRTDLRPSSWDLRGSSRPVSP